jgi:multisubunit Na+/H+ antiporter MnhG subunit
MRASTDVDHGGVVIAIVATAVIVAIVATVVTAEDVIGIIVAAAIGAATAAAGIGRAFHHSKQRPTNLESLENLAARIAAIPESRPCRANPWPSTPIVPM